MRPHGDGPIAHDHLLRHRLKALEEKLFTVQPEAPPDYSPRAQPTNGIKTSLAWAEPKSNCALSQLQRYMYSCLRAAET